MLSFNTPRRPFNIKGQYIKNIALESKKDGFCTNTKKKLQFFSRNTYNTYVSAKYLRTYMY